jgi:acylphosphatase
MTRRKRADVETLDRSKEEPCIEFVVDGCVQGVGFRFFTQRVATRLGVRGFVRNLPDGRVQVVARAPTRTLEEFEELLKEGPRLSHVSAVTRRDHPASEFVGFDIRH